MKLIIEPLQLNNRGFDLIISDLNCTFEFAINNCIYPTILKLYNIFTLEIIGAMCRT